MTTIAVFGSSMVKPGDADYAAAEAVGKALAQAGCAVMTGGYAGIMEAASKGAGEAGGHVIGVTTEQIKALRPESNANRWVIDNSHYPTLGERLDHLIRKADGYVIMPGGVGTLNELALTWEYMRVRDIPVRPIICYGGMWQHVIETFMDDRYVPAHHQTMIDFAHTPDEVVATLRAKEVLT
jgi:uncharacterized protein (TIGR00730 family)